MFEFLAAHFQSVVLAALEFGDALLVDIEADDGALFAEFYGQGEADVA